MSIINVEDLSVKIGNVEILKNISFHVEKGCIYGLVGHNGAGKTTLLRVLLGLMPQYSGSVTLFEQKDLATSRAKVGAVMDIGELERQCTAQEYLYRVCMMVGQPSRARAKELLQKVGLSESGDKMIGKYSLGMKRRLMVACALAGDPQLLILDEPFNGIDPRGMSELRLIMQMLASEGLTILVTSHMIPELIKLANVFGIMHQGKFISCIPSEELGNSRVEKTVIKVHNPLPFIERMAKLYPQLCCLSDSPGEVSVFADIKYSDIQQVCDALQIGPEDFGRSYMTGEDILLWKMEGYEN